MIKIRSWVNLLGGGTTPSPFIKYILRQEAAVGQIWNEDIRWRSWDAQSNARNAVFCSALCTLYSCSKHVIPLTKEVKRKEKASPLIHTYKLSISCSVCASADKGWRAGEKEDCDYECAWEMLGPSVNRHSTTGKKKTCPEMEFLNIKLKEDSSLLHHASHSPFQWRILQKSYSILVLTPF